MTPAGRRGGGWWLPLLVVLLPFEPRRPTLSIAGIEITMLEAAAALATLAMAVSVRERLASVWRTRPGPWLALWAYAAAQILSALGAPEHPDLALRFSLRMVAMAVFATVVAALPEEARRRGLAALSAAAAGVALLAIAEGCGARGLDGFLGLFREAPVNVAGVRRATAGSEHPNLAAAFLMYGLLAAVGLWGSDRRRLVPIVGLASLLGLGLAFTYSRGAAVATIAGLLALAVRDRRHAGVPASAAVTVAAVLAIFAAAGGGWRPAAAYEARYEPADATLQLAPGERRRVAVRLTNTGRETWTPEAIALSYHWLRDGALATDDGPRPPLPQAVEPGQAVTVHVEILAPRADGAYRLVWDLVRDDGTWFSGQGVAPAVVEVVVGDRPVAARPPASPLVWQPRRGELWRLAVSLWKENPLLGVGPDNYRRLYGAAAGRSSWDDRVYANNTLLEAAATTGLLGASALAAALLLTLWRAARSASPAAAAIFPLAVGLAAHGLVDYVLAMTGHYLVFGLTVGAASARRDDNIGA